uniref:Putative stress responsive protein n=1 Tax=Arabidopsis thaliana TaxID=3702 RepID=Q8GWH0_ARATH|nr:putative stress responsive protein [Arabidopsis thaliana]
MPSNCEILCEIIIAILLPPLGVCFRKGCCTVSSLSLSFEFLNFEESWNFL